MGETAKVVWNCLEVLWAHEGECMGFSCVLHVGAASHPKWDGLEGGGGTKLPDLCVCASACALVKRRLGNLRFCDDDRETCMPMMMATRD